MTVSFDHRRQHRAPIVGDGDVKSRKRAAIRQLGERIISKLPLGISIILYPDMSPPF